MNQALQIALALAPICACVSPRLDRPVEAESARTLPSPVGREQSVEDEDSVDLAQADAQEKPLAKEAARVADNEFWRNIDPYRSSWFGYGASWIEDINGDDSRDIVVPDLVLFEIGESCWSKEVLFLISGSDGEVIKTVDLPFGQSESWWPRIHMTAASGDLDGDGHQEILVAGSRTQSDGERVHYVLAVSPGSGAAIWEQDKAPALGWFGGALEGADFDGDGVLDLMIYGSEDSSANPEESMGRLVIVSGQTGEFLLNLVDEEGLGEFYAACVLSDLNGDGHPDFAIAVASEEHGGSVEVRSGLSGEVLSRFRSPEGAYVFGFTLAAIDLNGDSVQELIVGATKVIVQGGSSARWRSRDVGSLYVYDLGSGDLVTEFGSDDWWNGGSLDPYSGHIAIVPMPSEEQLETSSSLRKAPDSIDCSFAGSNAMLIVSDESAFLENVKAYSLSDGRGLWTVDSQATTDLAIDLSNFDYHLGSSLAIDHLPGTGDCISGIAGTANHVNHLQDPSIWCFDVASGRILFQLDVKEAHRQVGALMEWQAEYLE